MLRGDVGFRTIGLPPIDAGHDRAMLCGSPAMLADLSALLDARGAEYPAEHNVGHLYEAKSALADFYRSIVLARPYDDASASFVPACLAGGCLRDAARRRVRPAP